MLYFDRSMFYTDKSVCQSSSDYTFKIYPFQGMSVLPQKKNS